MGVLDRNVTRTVLDLAGTPVETTRETQTPASDPLAWPLTTTSKFRMGFRGPFSSRHFSFATLNTTVSSVTIQYFDGTNFVDVEDLVDQTMGLTRNGFIHWVNGNDWEMAALAPILDKELFWVELTVDTNLDVGTEVESVLNLFSDEDILRRYYPELVTDTRYLPPGRTSLVEQLMIGTDEVIKRLRQDKIIENETQILAETVNQLCIPATHFTAYAIYLPIAKDDADKQSRDEAFNAGNANLNDVKLTLDFNKSGIIEEFEEDAGDFFIKRG